MSHFPTAVVASIMVTVLLGGTALMASHAEAARMTKAEKVTLRDATVACKAEAKGKKIRWLAKRKFVNTCVAKALKGHPDVNVMQLVREHRHLKTLRGQQPSEWGCPSSC